MSSLSQIMLSPSGHMRAANVPLPAPPAPVMSALESEASYRDKQLRSLVSLLIVYTLALGGVILLSDGADVGCVLAAVAGHVTYIAAQQVRSARVAMVIADRRSRRGDLDSRAPTT